MVNEDKIYKLRQYKNFPKRKNSDPIIQVFDTFEEASEESMDMNRVSKERFYVEEVPHTEIVLTKRQKKFLMEQYGLK